MTTLTFSSSKNDENYDHKNFVMDAGRGRSPTPWADPDRFLFKYTLSAIAATVAEVGKIFDHIYVRVKK